MGLGNHLEALLLLSLSRISINPDQDAVCNEPLSSVMSRLGFHTATVDGSTFVSCSRYRILALGNPCAAIAYDSDSGNRLELGGFNILGLRASLRPNATCWAHYGLPGLDFPSVCSLSPPFCTLSPAARPLPFFNSSNAKRPSAEDKHHLRSFMEWANATTDDLLGFTFPADQRVEFAHSCMPEMYRQLTVGRLHRYSSKSSSGDACARIAECDILVIQYKNERVPMQLGHVKTEAGKVKVTGFNVWLLIVPISGHTIAGANPDENIWINSDGVQVLILCTKSVMEFLGVSLVSNIRGSQLVADGVNRLSAYGLRSVVLTPQKK